MSSLVTLWVLLDVYHGLMEIIIVFLLVSRIIITGSETFHSNNSACIVMFYDEVGTGRYIASLIW